LRESSPGITEIVYSNVMDIATYQIGDIGCGHSPDTCTARARTHAGVPYDGRVEFRGEDVDDGERAGRADLPQHRQDYRHPVKVWRENGA